MGVIRNAQNVGDMAIALAVAMRSRLTPVLLSRNGRAVTTKPATRPKVSMPMPISHEGGGDGESAAAGINEESSFAAGSIPGSIIHASIQGGPAAGPVSAGRCTRSSATITLIMSIYLLIPWRLAQRLGAGAKWRRYSKRGVTRSLPRICRGTETTKPLRRPLHFEAMPTAFAKLPQRRPSR